MGSASLSDEGHHQWRSHVLACGCGCTPPKSKNKLLPSDFDPVCTPPWANMLHPPQPSSSSKPSSLEPITGSQEDEKCSAYTRFPSRLASVTAAADGLSSHPIRACALCLCFLRSGETASRRLRCLSQRSCGAPLQSGRRRLAACLHLVRALLEVAEVHKAAIYLFLVDICLFLSQVI